MRPSLKESPYRILFGREPRSHIDVVAQGLDSTSFGQRLERAVTDQQRMAKEILVQRHEAQNRQRNRHNQRGVRIARRQSGCR